MNGYQRFIEQNKITFRDINYNAQNSNQQLEKIKGNQELEIFFLNFGGLIIDLGLFRFYTIGASYIWTAINMEYFTKYKNNGTCIFGSDWMGRNYGISHDGNIVYMFDPATAEVFEMNGTLQSFLNEDLVDYKEETLNASFFSSLMNERKYALNSDQCLGFKKLLFLGGEDIAENYELIDMEVYWNLNYQVYCQINNLEGGTVVNQIDIT